MEHLATNQKGEGSSPSHPSMGEKTTTGCGLVWLKRLGLGNQEIVGSNPAALTNANGGGLE